MDVEKGGRMATGQWEGGLGRRNICSHFSNRNMNSLFCCCCCCYCSCLLAPSIFDMQWFSICCHCLHHRERLFSVMIFHQFFHVLAGLVSSCCSYYKRTCMEYWVNLHTIRSFSLSGLLYVLYALSNACICCTHRK